MKHTMSQLRHNAHLEVKAAQRLRFWVTVFILSSLALILTSFACLYYKHENTAITLMCIALAGMTSASLFGKKR